jgi:hypothetical protein
MVQGAFVFPHHSNALKSFMVDRALFSDFEVDFFFTNTPSLLIQRLLNQDTHDRPGLCHITSEQTCGDRRDHRIYMSRGAPIFMTHSADGP